VLLPSDEVLPLLAAALAVGTPQEELLAAAAAAAVAASAPHAAAVEPVYPSRLRSRRAATPSGATSVHPSERGAAASREPTPPVAERTDRQTVAGQRRPRDDASTDGVSCDGSGESETGTDSGPADAEAAEDDDGLSTSGAQVGGRRNQGKDGGCFRRTLTSTGRSAAMRIAQRQFMQPVSTTGFLCSAPHLFLPPRQVHSGLYGP
jgi:hypothetical protein